MDAANNLESMLWTTDLSVGSAELDERNRQIFVKLAAVEMMITSGGTVALPAWLWTLFEQFEALLLEEERELALIDYPEAGFHITLHEHARQIIEKARAQLRRPDATETLPQQARAVCAALSMWLMRHVLDADKLFFPYIDARYRTL